MSRFSAETMQLLNEFPLPSRSEPFSVASPATVSVPLPLMPPATLSAFADSRLKSAIFDWIRFAVRLSASSLPLITVVLFSFPKTNYF